MGGDDQGRRATTKRFTHAELAELAAKARADVYDAPPVADDLQQARDEEAVSGAPDAVAPEITPMSRAETLHDPMTTQLLAEVARRLHQTIELDPQELTEAQPESEPDVAHPHLRRRT